MIEVHVVGDALERSVYWTVNDATKLVPTGDLTAVLDLYQGMFTLNAL